MKITKHGNKWYYFVCPCCGCEWVAGTKEVHQRTVAYDDRIAMFCECPECGYDTAQDGSDIEDGTGAEDDAK